jgi:triosephosphate isomerase (TIM)
MPLRKLIAGNWKMNGNLAALNELPVMAELAGKRSDLDVAICPPATLIAAASVHSAQLAIGGQDCHWNASGAHTGCLSAAQLKEAGATMVIVGHSERRADQHETSAEVCQKAEAAMAAGLIAIVCVGETEAERDAGHAVAIVTQQVAQSVPPSAKGSAMVVAYEPVWAIGTGRTPTAADIADMHGAIRQQLIDQIGDEGHAVRILYGGSVKPSNAAELMHLPNVDGALVGGASLKAEDFCGIIALS